LSRLRAPRLRVSTVEHCCRQEDDMALVKPMEKKLIAVRAKLEKELKSKTLTAAKKQTIKGDIKSLTKIIAAMKAGTGNHNIC